MSPELEMFLLQRRSHSQALGAFAFVRTPSSPQQDLTLALNMGVDGSVVHPKAVLGSSGWVKTG